MSGTGRPGQPGRYSRSASGLVVSMVVIVLGVVAFVGLHNLLSSPVDDAATPMDYRSSIRDLQQNGFDPVYPASLPAGWTTFNLDYTPGSSPAFGLDIHTPDQRYIGLRQAPGPVSALLTADVDADPIAGASLSTPGGLVGQWSGWSDSGGDHAYTAVVGGDAVIVFGPAPVEDLQTVVRLLTKQPIGTASPSGEPSSSPAG